MRILHQLTRTKQFPSLTPFLSLSLSTPSLFFSLLNNKIIPSSLRCGRRPEKRFFKRRRLTIRQQEDLTRRGGLTGGFLPWGWGREGRHFPASPGGTAPGGAVRMQRRGGVRQGRDGRFLPRPGKGGGVLGPLGCWMSKRRVWTPTSGLQLQVGFLVAGHSGATICRGLSAQRGLLDKSRPLSSPRRLPLTLCKTRRWLDLEGFWWLTAHSSWPCWRCSRGGCWRPGQKQAGRPHSSFVDQWAPQSGESGPSLGAVSRQQL